MLYFDEGYFREGEEVFFPQVEALGAENVKGNTAVIRLPARMNDDLKWEKERQQAEELIKQGKRILWFVDLGLFSSLTQPLKDAGQWASFKFALEHFVKDVWNQYKESSLGLSFCQHSLDLQTKFQEDPSWEQDFTAFMQASWNESEALQKDYLSLESTSLNSALAKDLLPSYSFDVAVQYLQLLAAPLPAEIPLHCFWDATNFSLAKTILYSSKELWERFTLWIKGAILTPDFSWGNEKGVKGEMREKGGFSTFKEEAPSEALIIPETTLLSLGQLKEFTALCEALTEKLQNGVLKLVPDTHLIYEWSGLETIYLAKGLLSFEGKRRMQGFQAAGGEVLTLENGSWLTHPPFSTCL